MQTKCSVSKGARRPRDGQTAHVNTHRRHDYDARLPHVRGATKAPQTLRKRPGRAALVEPREMDRSGRGTRQRREADSKKIYIHRAKQAQFVANVKLEGLRPRTGTGGESGSAAGMMWANHGGKSGRFVRRPRPRKSARTPGRLVARAANGGGVQMRFQMFSKQD